MKLTDLVKQENYMELTEAHKIEVDEFLVDIPYHFKEIGLIAQKGDDGRLSMDLMDVSLALMMNDVSVILEIPFDFDMPAKDIALVCATSNMSMAILPPEEKSQRNYEQYSETLCKYTEVWLSQTGAQKMLYPTTGYLQYMVNEVFGFKTPEISTDKYIIENFVEPIPLDIMDEIKLKLREVILNAFGGKAGFETFAHSLANSLSETLVDKAS